MNKDLTIYETGDGGDLYFKNGDLKTSPHLYQQVYLARFSGDGNFWGNALFNKKYSSKLESKLNNVSLNSTGRNELQRDAESDIDYLRKISKIETVVRIAGIDKVEIIDTLNQLNTIISTTWNVAKGELLEQRFISRNGGNYLIYPSGGYIIDPDGSRIKI